MSFNPDSRDLVRQLMASQNPEKVLQDAVVDAQLHSDWSRVSAIENGIPDVKLRAVARRVQAEGGRGFVVERGDASSLADRIPEGEQFAISWIVTAVMLLPDGDYDRAVEIAEEFHARVIERSDLDQISWSPAVLCAPTHGFGPPTRCMVTKTMFEGDRQVWHRSRFSVMQQEKNRAANNAAPPLSFLVWGVYTSGTSDLRDLFNKDIWAPGLASDQVEKVVELLAEAATTVGGETFVHPQLMPADEANDFALEMSREQAIDDLLSKSFKEPKDAIAVVAPLEASNIPYMDQVQLNLWTKYGSARQTFRIPRLGRPLEEDVQWFVDALKRRGVVDVHAVTPERKVPHEYTFGRCVDVDGKWWDAEDAFLGPAAAFIRDFNWRRPGRVAEVSQGARHLPIPQLLAEAGAAGCLSGHYESKTWVAVQEGLSHPGDPIVSIRKALESIDLDGSLRPFIEHDANWVLPDREVALAVQFRRCRGAIALVEPALLELLENTNISDLTPAELMRPAFDVVYFRLRQPFQGNEDQAAGVLDGILVQRWVDDLGTHLLLDGFVHDGGASLDEALDVGLITFEFLVGADATLGELLGQLNVGDDSGRELLRTVAGVSLYMNSRDARMVKKEDRTTAAAEFGAMNRKKRGKPRIDHVASTYDHIVVGPEESLFKDLAVNGDGTRTVAPHFRRGFVRFNQKVGPGRKQVRPVFVHHSLVNVDKVRKPEDEPSKRAYRLRS